MKKSVAMAKRNPMQTNNLSIKSENSSHPAYCLIGAFVSFGLVVVFVLSLWQRKDIPMYQVHKTLCCLINWYPGYKYLNATQRNHFVCTIHSHQNLINAVMKYSQRCHFHTNTHTFILEIISIVSSEAQINIVDSSLFLHDFGFSLSNGFSSLRSTFYIFQSDSQFIADHVSNTVKLINQQMKFWLNILLYMRPSDYTLNFGVEIH